LLIHIKLGYQITITLPSAFLKGKSKEKEEEGLPHFFGTWEGDLLLVAVLEIKLGGRRKLL
jgi:hypothetical protein